MERQFNVGQHVVYVDQYGKRHDALITIWWSAYEPYLSETGQPGCNLVLVSGEEAKTDSYGRQIERETSVVHRSKQVAHGRYWCWPDEV